MRTSIEIPDPLFKAAKRLALERETTLKTLVAEGLEAVLARTGALERDHRADSRRLPKVRPAGEGTYAMRDEDVDRLLAEEEASSYGRPH